MGLLEKSSLAVQTRRKVVIRRRRNFDQLLLLRNLPLATCISSTKSLDVGMSAIIEEGPERALSV